MKSILVPLDPSEFTQAATLRACELATYFKARIKGLTIVDIEGIEDEIRLPFRIELMDYPRKHEVELVRASREKLVESSDRFCRTCENQGVACEILETRGAPEVRILDEARFHDLVVMGLRSHFRFITKSDDDDVLHNVIRHACGPLLLVPAREPRPITKVVIAFDGSPPATRAMQRFAHIAQCWKPEIKLVASMNESEGTPILDSARSYLEEHGLDRISTDLVEKSIIEAFQDLYIDWADLCVLGASSKSVVEKMLVGSFPRKLILDGHIPLFISP